MVEARNQAESLVHSTEKNIEEYGDKVEAADKEAIEKDLADLKEAMEGDSVEDIEAKTQTLMQSSMKLGEAIYKAQQDETAAEGEGPDNPEGTATAEDGVVDAEFEEVDDRKDKSA